jgi:hypothetical protein
VSGGWDMGFEGTFRQEQWIDRGESDKSGDCYTTTVCIAFEDKGHRTAPSGTRETDLLYVGIFSTTTWEDYSYLCSANWMLIGHEHVDYYDFGWYVGTYGMRPSSRITNRDT